MKSLIANTDRVRKHS